MSYLTWLVLIGTGLLGAVSGVLGTFAVLRRRALVGDLLSHTALPGLCVAFLLVGERRFVALLAGALAAGLLAVATLTFLRRATRTKEDAAIGIILSTFFGLGIVLLSYIQSLPLSASQAGLETFLFGQAAGMIRQDVVVIAAVSCVSLLLVTVLYKEFLLLSFDPEFAAAQGWPVTLLDLVLMGALALMTVTGLPAVGVVLMTALLIVPAASARFWTERLGPMLLLAGLFGFLAAAMGTLTSAGVVERWLGFDPFAFGDTSKNLPTGPVIVLSGTALFLASVLFAPRRGALARAWAEARLRRKTARENLLRTMYDLTEGELPARPVVTVDALRRERAWSAATARWLVARAVRRGWLEREGSGFRLTEPGLAEAQRLTRIHRLWEHYLIERAAIAPDHVDRDADAIEHLLPESLVDELAATSAGEVPDSPHSLP